MLSWPRRRKCRLRPAGARQQRRLTHQRLAGGSRDLHRHNVAGLAEALEVDHLVVALAAAQAARIGARRAFDEHLDRPPDEPLRAFARSALDELHEPLDPLDLDLVLHKTLRQ